MSSRYILYVEHTGEIVTLSTSSFNLKVLGDDENCLPDRQMVQDGEIVDRPVLDVADVEFPADGDEHVIASGVPEGTGIYVDDRQVGTVGTDGEVRLSAAAARVYSLRLEPPFPHLEATVTVKAVQD